MNLLTIKGMHCDACKKLIMMELEDHGLNNYVASLEISGENIGALSFRDGVSDDVVLAVRKIIDDMDNYSIE